jgi:hypothetical protein
MPNKSFNSSFLDNLFIGILKNSNFGECYVKGKEGRSRKEEKVLLLQKEREKSQRSQEVSATYSETLECTFYHG